MRVPATFQTNYKRHITSNYWLRHTLIRRDLAYNAKSSFFLHSRDVRATLNIRSSYKHNIMCTFSLQNKISNGL